MLSVAEALQQLLAAATPLEESQCLPLRDALNRVLRKPVVAQTSAPAFDSSAMDGYAICLDQIPASNELPVVGRAAAGQAPGQLAPGTAMRIFTGAALPAGADSVCMQENCEAFKSGAEDWVRVIERPSSGANIRRKGEGFATGEILIESGVRLQPQHLGLCSAAGQANVEVTRPLRVAIFSTGDELVEPGAELKPGQIYNSNQIMLETLVRKLGCKISQSKTLPDNPENIRTALKKAAARSDLIVSSGGVSVGEEDHMKAVVSELGQLDLWRIAVKPGKPLAFGSVGDCGYMGLPGNPVSSFVTFCLFAAPYIRQRQGESEFMPKPIKVTALNGSPAGSREEYLRGRLEGNGVKIFGHQGSHLLTGLSQADGLVRRPAGLSIKAGEHIQFYSFCSLV